MIPLCSFAERPRQPGDAIERMAQEAFDCVIVDLIMPKMDGIEVCRRITELNHGKVERQPAAVMFYRTREPEMVLAPVDLEPNRSAGGGPHTCPLAPTARRRH